MARAKSTSTRRRPAWTLADYATFAKERGGELLTPRSRDSIPRAHDKLHFRCKHGHEWTPQATAIKNQGYWCFRCARGGNKTWTIGQYRSHADANGGELLNDRPDDHRPLVTERLRFRCTAGHTWETVAYSIVRDRGWCRVCSRTADPWDASRYRQYAKEHGGRLISRHPAGVLEHKVVVRFRCSAGHAWDTTAGQVKSYQTWCQACANTSRRKPVDDLRALAAERGGELVTQGRNRWQPYVWRCSRGHKFKARPAEVLKGSWCGDCSASRSERLVRAHFEQIFGRPFPRVRPVWLTNTTGHRLELDGFCEKLSLAFEHQGGQHYQEVAHFSRQSLADICRRDARKRRICRERGVTLIEIPEVISRTPLNQLRKVILRACRAAGVKLPRGAATRPIAVSPVYTNTRDDEALDELRRIAEAKGGECLAAEYLGSEAHLEFRCSSGHTWQGRPADIRQGTWCRRCALKATADRKRLTIDIMRDIAHDRGGECLSDTYVDTTKKLRWRCGKCAHEWEATPGSIRQGRWCKPCGTKEGWNRRRERFGSSGGNGNRAKRTGGP